MGGRGFHTHTHTRHHIAYLAPPSPLSCLSLASLSPLYRLVSPLSLASLVYVWPTSRLHLACISRMRLEMHHLANADPCGARPYLGRISAVSRAPGGPPPPLRHLGALHR